MIPRLVDAAGVLAAADFGDWALVGGLAVMMQLALATTESLLARHSRSRPLQASPR